MSYPDVITTVHGLVADSLNYGSVVPFIDFLRAEAPAASVQRLSGVRWIERYLDGGGIGEVPFAVLLRVPNADSKTRYDAGSALEVVLDTLEAYSDDNIEAIRGEDSPSKVDADATTETWRVQLTAVVSRSAILVS